MSVFRPMPLVCSGCGARNVETVALSLHGSRVPQVVDEIVAGTFQCFTCASCALRYRADGPLIYVDFERKRWVGEFPSHMERSWASLEQQPMDSFRRSLIDLAPAFLRSEADGFTIRAVFGLDALAEKIRLLDAGIDDRAVEVAKLATVLRTGSTLAPRYRPRVVSAGPGSVVLRLWSRDSAEEQAQPGHLSLSTSEVMSFAADPEWATVSEELQVGPYVDLGRLLFDGRSPLREHAPCAAP